MRASLERGTCLGQHRPIAWKGKYARAALELGKQAAAEKGQWRGWGISERVLAHF